MPQEFYNEEDAEQILRLATHQSLSGGLTREALLRTAAEVGLSEAEINAAEAQLSQSRNTADLADRFRQRQRGRFIQGVLSYIGVNAFLIGVWWMTGHGYFWPGWALVGMALGSFDEISKCLIPSSAAYQRAFARWKRKGAPELDQEEEEAEGHVGHDRDQVIIGIHAHRRDVQARRRGRP
ncbi:MAG TPA: 2TM domain-containing protein [Fimbriimonadaceae bacterium]|nr:2TM domain-containing protein [Fimbriimonadaceae bacterium]